MGMFSYNKKGQSILDITLLVMILVGITIAIFTARLIGNELEQSLVNDTDVNSSNSQFWITNVQQWHTNLDFIFPLIIVGLGVIMFASVALIRSTPILLIPAMMLLIPTIIIAAQFSNAFDDIEGDGGDIGDVSSTDYPIMNFFWDKMPLILTVIMAITFIILYRKPIQGELGV